ncbi:MAG: DNA polymerase I [Bacteroidales bacterium]|nr:DNA polymerase I [Bacteroidales bacterium]
MNRLFLIDGHALVFRMYYAFLRRPMVNSKGEDMSILFGFTKYLLELVEREHPTHLAVAFDPPGKTFRHERYPEYKGTRPPTPQLVKDALQPLVELCGMMRIPVLMRPGFEADDVIGSMACRCAAEGLDVYMVTPDKDYSQLVADHIFQYRPSKAGQLDEVFDKVKICEKYAISEPSQVVDMLTICGDSADNIPGVKGIGEVGAAKLLARFGSVANIYARLEELTPRQKEAFAQAAGHLELSNWLVKIKTDIDLSDVRTEDMLYSSDWDPAIAAMFDHYEFGSLKKYLSGIKASEKTARKSSTAFPELVELGASDFCVKAAEGGACALLLDGDRLIAATADGSYVKAPADGGALKPLLSDASVAKCGYAMKGLYRRLLEEGVKLQGRLMDVELMHYVLNPERSHSLDGLSGSYLGVSLEGSAPSGEATLFDGVDEDAEGLRLREAIAAGMLVVKLREELEDKGIWPLYEEIEEPLLKVLAKMEMTGVKVDLHSLEDFTRSLRSLLDEIQARVREAAGDPEFNISSPRQVGVLVFEKLRLDPKAKQPSKGSWKTDEDTLSALSDRSPVIGDILEYRGVKKLLSTYIEPYPGFISPLTGRIHTTFNQTLTSTGRLSSSKPNLQNIPIRTERGKMMRKAFVPEREGWLMLSADYSQIELRIMACLCGDEHMVEAFRRGEDVHRATAAKIFGIPAEEVSSDQRRAAKTTNFGIMYGISSFGLAKNLGVGRKEAQTLIDEYYENFPSIVKFKEKTLADAREKGYVETMFGRRRYLPDINASNAVVRSMAERNAVNAPIQGTAADIIKLAMIAIDGRMEEEGMKSRMVLQIHDELVFEAAPDEVERLSALVRETMENVVALQVPLIVECNYGKDWLEAH